MAPAPEGVPRAGAEPHGSPGPAAADERVLDHGPCSSPGCTHIGVRLYGRHCPNHVLGWIAAAFDGVEAAALARPDPLEANPFEAAIEADVLRATRPPRPRQWWRCDEPYYALIAGLCLDYYRGKGWPIKRDPTGKDIEPLLAKEEQRAAVPGNDRMVRDRFRTVTRRMQRRTGQARSYSFTMARDDARAEFAAEHGARSPADYAKSASG